MCNQIYILGWNFEGIFQDYAYPLIFLEKATKTLFVFSHGTDIGQMREGRKEKERPNKINKLFP
jgi:hypothetical protein